VWEPSAVLRRDRYRTVTVEADVSEGTTAIAVIQEITPWLEAQTEDWPIGYRFEFGGEIESSVKANASIGEKMPIAFLVIILLLVAQFNSIRKAFMVLATIPLAIIGVVIGLLVFREEFGFMPFLGVISLAGIVINNAIVLLDRIEIEQSELGRSPQDAVIVACLQRFRPILLATLTTVLGLVPLYLSGGEMWEGMAIAIMIGLLFGTVVTLGFIPALYSILFRVDYAGYEGAPELVGSADDDRPCPIAIGAPPEDT